MGGGRDGAGGPTLAPRAFPHSIQIARATEGGDGGGRVKSCQCEASLRDGEVGPALYSQRARNVQYECTVCIMRGS